MNGDEVYRHSDRVEYRSLADDGGVLLHLDTASYHGVNAVGALIWKLCTEGATVAQILAGLRAELADTPATLEDDVVEYVEQLTARELLVVEPAAPSEP